MSDDVVGHKTFHDGHDGYRHEPLTRTEADELLRSVEANDARRKELMPDEQAALCMLFDAWQRLKEFGWNDAVYCPKDGRLFEVVECGSTGVHKCSYDGEWPDGTWWIHEDGDSMPSRPTLFRPLPPNARGNRRKDRVAGFASG